MSYNYKEQKISSYLRNAREIKKIMIENNTTRPPSRNSEIEKEQILGEGLNRIRTRLIKPYLELTVDEEKEKFRKKHPEIDEVLEIVNWIDENNKVHLRNLKEIRKWMEENDTAKPPAQDSKEKTEKRLANALDSARKRLIKPFLNLKTEDEREEYRKKHPEIDEVLEIVNWIDENKKVYLRNAKEALKWMEKNETTKAPSKSSVYDKERKLGTALEHTKYNFIKPYLELRTEEEKEKFRKEYPEIDEVMKVVIDIYKDDNKKARQRLSELMKQDLEKRTQVAEAKELEKRYEEELEKEKEKGNTKEEGVVHDEQ